MDNLTKTQRRKNMQNIRSIGTMPEKIIEKTLKKKGIYFAAHVASLPGKPDIVFRKKKITVFIDSDFWHGHPKRGVMPKTNRRYWKEKIAANKKRDKKVTDLLHKMGWRVLRLWEFNVKRYPEKCTQRIISLLNESP